MNDLYSPDLVSLEYTPSLSASGSVARIISASTSLASLNAYVNALGSSGLWLQGLTTKEPDDEMIEVGIASVEAVFDWKPYVEEIRREMK